MKVSMLDHVRWELMGLSHETEYEVACGLDRLERGPRLPAGVERVGGTRRLYRWRKGDCRILFIQNGDAILVLSLSIRPRRLPERYRRRGGLPGGD